LRLSLVSAMAESAALARVAALARQIEEAEMSLARHVAAASAVIADLRRELAAAEHAAADEPVLALNTLSPLLPELVRLVFALLPADSRLRCRQVCRAWRAFLAERRLWQVCDLSAASSVARPRTPALLLAACAQAGDQLRSLDVSGWRQLPFAVLLRVVRANSESLLELRAGGCTLEGGGAPTPPQLEALLKAAPRLSLLAADAQARPAAAQQLLSRGGVFAPLHLSSLAVSCATLAGLQVEHEPVQLLAAAGAHASLEALELTGAELSEAAVARALAEGLPRLRMLSLAGCRLAPDTALPQLSRLLSPSSALRELRLSDQPLLFEGEAVASFCAALRAAPLHALRLHNLGLWRAMEEAMAVLDACAGHASLRLLAITQPATTAAARARVGRALAALLAGGGLEELAVDGCHLHDEGAEPLFRALPGSGLRRLSCTNNFVSPRCAAEAVLPAVRACGTLLLLRVNPGADDAWLGGGAVVEALADAEALVRARGETD